MVVVCLYTYCRHICLYSLLSIVLPVLANKLFIKWRTTAAAVGWKDRPSWRDGFERCLTDGPAKWSSWRRTNRRRRTVVQRIQCWRPFTALVWICYAHHANNKTDNYDPHCNKFRFLARDVIYTSRAYAMMSVSVCLSVRLSVTEVHWRIIANLGFKFRSHYTAHCGRRAASGR